MDLEDLVDDDSLLELIVKIAKYVFDHHGIKLAQLDSFWEDFPKEYPEFSYLDVTDLRITFMCDVLLKMSIDNIYDLPDKVFCYLKVGDYDLVEEYDEDCDETLQDTDIPDILFGIGAIGQEPHLNREVYRNWANNEYQILQIITPDDDDDDDDDESSNSHSLND